MNDKPDLSDAQKRAIWDYWKNKPYVTMYGSVDGGLNLVIHDKNPYLGRKESANLCDIKRLDSPQTGKGFCCYWPGDHKRAVAYYNTLWTKQLTLDF